MTECPSIEAYIENTYPQWEANQTDCDRKMVQEIPWSDWFAAWLEYSQADLPLAEKYELSLRLTDDGEITELNSRYRQKDQPTDVLAFAALDNDPVPPSDLSQPLYLGDIAISLDTAKEQAKEQNHSLSTEIAWLSSHGFLHLLGWDHPDPDSLEKMLQQQANLLKIVEITE